MPQRDAEFMNRARRARDKLVDQFLDHPEVSLIDIGHAPKEQGGKTDQLVLRIHVRESWTKARPKDRVAFPDQVDGIPVVVIPGDYQIE